MNYIEFRRRYREIVKIDASEGPPSNIFEPKFIARKEMIILMEMLEKHFEHENNAEYYLLWIAECLIFIGRNMLETEEEDDGCTHLCKAYFLLRSVVSNIEMKDLSKYNFLTVNEILRDCDDLKIDITRFSKTVLPYMRTLNALGMLLSTNQIESAIKVLRSAEVLYRDWQEWLLKQSCTITLQQLEIDEFGELKLSNADNEVVNNKETELYWTDKLQFVEIEKEYTLTLFSLAQSYSVLKQVELASVYCQYTLVQQFKCKQEFDKKKWSDNAIQLSQFYVSNHEYEKGIHCIQAGESILAEKLINKKELCKENIADTLINISSENNTSCNAIDKETNTVSTRKSELKALSDSNDDGCAPMKEGRYDNECHGRIAWAYGALYLHYLEHCVPEHQPVQDKRTKASETNEVSNENLSAFHEWINLPGATPLENLTRMNCVNNITEARAIFKITKKYFYEALNYYPFQSCCTDHIQISQSICRLYAALSKYESDRNRVIAILMREITMIEEFPFKLSFKAYPTTVRQLLYDVGCLYTELVNLRAAQRRECTANELPLSNNAFNSLIHKTQLYITNFLGSWINSEHYEQHWPIKQKTEKIALFENNARVIEQEASEAYLNAVINLCQCLSQYCYNDLHTEYDGLQVCIYVCQHGLRFSQINCFGGTRKLHVEREVGLLRELLNMLSTKQKNIYLTAQRNGLF